MPYCGITFVINLYYWEWTGFLKYIVLVNSYICIYIISLSLKEIDVDDGSWWHVSKNLWDRVGKVPKLKNVLGMYNEY